MSGNDIHTTSLLHFEASYVDSNIGGSPKIWSPAYNARISELSSKFGIGSGEFYSGTQSTLLTTYDAPDWRPAGDFCIDFWIQPTSTAPDGAVFGKGNNAGFSPYMITKTNGNWLFYASSNGEAWDIANGKVIGSVLNEWQHIEVDRSGNNYYLFVNGILGQTFGSALLLMTSTDSPWLGNSRGNPGNGFDGWIDEFRFSNVARHTAPFAPPTSAYSEDPIVIQSTFPDVVVTPTTVPDQTPIIQAAINELTAAGGGRINLGEERFVCLTGPIVFDPTRISLIGGGALLDFSQRTNWTDPRCVLVASTASQYGQAAYKMEGIKLLGPGRVNGSIGLALETAAEPESSRLSIYNVDIHDFFVGIHIGSRCYITQFFSTAVWNCDTCLSYPSGANSGENLSFYGCSFFNSRKGIDDPAGGMLSFYGTSFDYLEQQFYSGTGLINFFGCWFERVAPTISAPLFDVIAGDLSFYGGLMQVTSAYPSPPVNSAIFALGDKYTRVLLDNMDLYNLKSATGALATGPGRLITRGRKVGNNSGVAAITNAGPNHDLFGGNGFFTVAGPVLPVQAFVTSTGAGDTSPYISQYGTIGIAGAPVNGLSCAEIIKTGGGGNVLAAIFLCPIQPGKLPMIRFNWSIQGAIPGPSVFWAQINAVQLIGYDSKGRPIAGPGAYTSIGQVQINPIITANPSAWAQVEMDTISTSSSSSFDGFTSEWVTHLQLSINMASLPACTLHITNLEAYAA